MASPTGADIYNQVVGGQTAVTSATPSGPTGADIYNQVLGGATPQAASNSLPKKHQNWLSRTVGGFASDLENIPSGIYDLAKTELQGDWYGLTHGGSPFSGNPYFDKEGTILKQGAKGIGESFAHPLRHTDQTFLNLLMLASGAGTLASTAAKLGEAGGLTKAGSLTSRLAHYSHPEKLSVPDFRLSAGQEGVRIPIGKSTSGNPVLKAKQLAVNRGLAKVAGLEGIGAKGKIGDFGKAVQTHRVMKAITYEASKAAEVKGIAGEPFRQAFAKLTKAEKVAWHLVARGTDAHSYRDFLLSEAHAGDNVSVKTLKNLKNPKVQHLVEHPTPRLTDALNQGRDLSHRLSEHHLEQGDITEEQAYHTPFNLLRLINGATRGKIGLDGVPLTYSKGSNLDSTFGIIDQPGRGITQLHKELVAKSTPELDRTPFYVHDTANIKDNITRPPGARGFSAAPKLRTFMDNLGDLVGRGAIDMEHNSLHRAWTMMRNRVEGQHIHTALQHHAALLPKNTPVPHGWDFLKAAGQKTPAHIQQILGRLDHGVNPGFVDEVLTKDELDPELMKNTKGERLIVPSNVRKILEGRSSTSSGILTKLLYNHPTSIWKHSVLGLRPAFLVNNSVGNTILSLLQSAPTHGFRSFANHVIPGLEKHLGPRLTDKTMEEHMPQQRLGSFGHSLDFASTKGMRLGGKLYQGVMPATMRYENLLRRAMVEGWAKHLLRDEMKQSGGDVNKAIAMASESHPSALHEISRKVDDALGDYRNYNKLEKQIRQLIPFYGWDRHIVRSMGRLANEHPTGLNALVQTGVEGGQVNEGKYGPLPDFLNGVIGMGSPTSSGRQPLITTHGWNPFATPGELAKAGESLISGKPGGGGEITSSWNPLLQGLLEQFTGKSLLTGNDLPPSPLNLGSIGNTIESTALSLPQIQLIQSLLGNDKNKPGFLYQHDTLDKTLAMLGLTRKQVNLLTANKMASNG